MTPRFKRQMLLSCGLTSLLIAFLTMAADAATVRWRGTDSWGAGDWDTTTANWRTTGGSPTTYANGDDVQIVAGVGISSFRGINVTAPMTPNSVLVELPNAFGSASFSGNNISTTGAFTIQSGGQVRLSGTTLSFGALSIDGATSYLQSAANPFTNGTDPISIDNGGRLAIGGTTTIANPVAIGSGGGNIGPDNAQLTYTGSMALGGNLTMGNSGDNSRARLNGAITLTGDASIVSQTGTASWSYSEINGGINGEFKLTLNNRGTGSGFRQKLQTGAVNVGSFEKIGTGISTISVGSILGSVSELEALGSDQYFSIQAGLVELTALTYANKLILGSSEFTNEGTYGSLSLGTADNLIDDGVWNTYFLNSNEMIELVAAASPIAPAPEPASLSLLVCGLFGMLRRIRSQQRNA